MLSYRHSFHAGNPADVLKHLVLVFCLEYLAGKERPFLCVDTHGGAGVYDLEEGQNREWEAGAGKLRAYAGSDGAAMPYPVARYLEAIRLAVPAAADGGKKTNSYPGSPLIAAGLLRKQDRLVCCELHPADWETLKTTLDNFGTKKGSRGNAPAMEVRREDGPASLKALLPPPSRRGLILTDPSWEEKDEYETIPRALAGALKRFPQGTYIVWYPLLAIPKSAAAENIAETLMALYAGSRCRAEMNTVPSEGHSPRRMYGSGLVIFNPPYTLKAALENCLPWLAGVLGEGGWRLDWQD
jgi:23S rRNA (adenine2030-N6)-methyltransferase